MTGSLGCSRKNQDQPDPTAAPELEEEQKTKAPEVSEGIRTDDDDSQVVTGTGDCLVKKGYFLECKEDKTKNGAGGYYYFPNMISLMANIDNEEVYATWWQEPSLLI